MKIKTAIFCVLFIALAVAGGKWAAGKISTSPEASETGNAPSSELAYKDENAAADGTKKADKTRHGNGLELPASLTDRPEEIVRHTAYTVSFNSRLKTPNWVAWELTAEHARGKVPRAQNGFQADPDLRGKSADYGDYRTKRYDKGHMCPAGDNKWSAQAMMESFYFTNVCPQVRALNVGDWNDLEITCRNWAKRYGKIYIACGPITPKKGCPTMGRNAVAIPEAFFKVVLRQDGKAYKAIGFIFPNNRESQRIKERATSVDEIERQTGIDFFCALPDNAERQAESSYNWNDWN